ncbi:MAG: hypothetical protein LBB76_10230 [Azoarcus sp.]|jgi:hypothetical protein|nr:hypothetical protein [Azoarcus sp.]
MDVRGGQKWKTIKSALLQQIAFHGNRIRQTHAWTSIHGMSGCCRGNSTALVVLPWQQPGNAFPVIDPPTAGMENIHRATLPRQRITGLPRCFQRNTAAAAIARDTTANLPPCA